MLENNLNKLMQKESNEEEENRTLKQNRNLKLKLDLGKPSKNKHFEVNCSEAQTEPMELHTRFYKALETGCKL